MRRVDERLQSAVPLPSAGGGEGENAAPVHRIGPSVHQTAGHHAVDQLGQRRRWGVGQLRDLAHRVPDPVGKHREHRPLVKPRGPRHRGGGARDHAVVHVVQELKQRRVISIRRLHGGRVDRSQVGTHDTQPRSSNGNGQRHVLPGSDNMTS